LPRGTSDHLPIMVKASYRDELADKLAS